MKLLISLSLKLCRLIAPITKERGRRLKLLYSEKFQLASSQCSALYLIYLPPQRLCCCFHLVFGSLWRVCV